MTERVVVLGGGTGLFTALSGLRQHSVELTAVVSMADNGGSTGRLRDEFGYLPAGDVRRCLVALASDDSAGMLLRQLFEYRFARGTGLAGHTFGNLMLTALTDITGGMDTAVLEAAHLLRVHGQVLPVTLEDTHLYAELVDGQTLAGETTIDTRGEGPAIKCVYLNPVPETTSQVRSALEEASMIVIGPGDLYTSVVPTLLVDGVRDAIRQSCATTVYVCNVMTKHGETDGYAASIFLQVITEYLGPDVLQGAILSYYPTLPADVQARYQMEKAAPVEIDIENCRKYAPHLMVRPLAAAGTLVRHDSDQLARALLDFLGERPPARDSAAS
ncbi:MAG TPA: gluconeogenesis factor YvcK family protein [Chloroflexota bacterium]